MLYFLLLLCTVNLLSIETYATAVNENDGEQSGKLPMCTSHYYTCLLKMC